jgi:hypothetical protein
MSHKIIAIVADCQFDPDVTVQKIRLQTSVTVRDTSNPANGWTFSSNIFVTGSENATQLNTSIVNQIKADMLNIYGVSHITDQDILVNKFV